MDEESNTKQEVPQPIQTIDGVCEALEQSINKWLSIHLGNAVTLFSKPTGLVEQSLAIKELDSVFENLKPEEIFTEVKQLDHCIVQFRNGQSKLRELEASIKVYLEDRGRARVLKGLYHAAKAAQLDEDEEHFQQLQVHFNNLVMGWNMFTLKNLRASLQKSQLVTIPDTVVEYLELLANGQQVTKLKNRE